MKGGVTHVVIVICNYTLSDVTVSCRYSVGIVGFVPCVTILKVCIATIRRHLLLQTKKKGSLLSFSCILQGFYLHLATNLLGLSKLRCRQYLQILHYFSSVSAVYVI